MFDALLILSYGGPEGSSDIRAFLENVMRGVSKSPSIPPERIEAAAKKYERLIELNGICSPISQACRDLMGGLMGEFQVLGPRIPIYWGNLFWYPLLSETLREMQDDGIERAAVFVTSGFDSPQGNRRYDEAIEKSLASLEGKVPVLTRLPLFWNDPLFHSAMADKLLEALARASLELESNEPNSKIRIVFTAHSIPINDSENCDYLKQVQEVSKTVAELAHLDLDGFSWEIAWQSRSGAPGSAWLTPSPEDIVHQAAEEGIKAIVPVPIGFFCENMETAYDLDVELAALVESLGMVYFRARTIGEDAKILKMIRNSLISCSIK